MVLEATYEATLSAGLLNYQRTKNNTVYLTLIGGGAFGNEKDWIFSALETSIMKFSNTPLDIRIVSYGNSNSSIIGLINSINEKINSANTAKP